MEIVIFRKYENGRVVTNASHRPHHLVLEGKVRVVTVPAVGQAVTRRDDVSAVRVQPDVHAVLMAVVD